MTFDLNFTHDQLPLSNVAVWQPRTTLLVGCGGLGSTVVNAAKAKIAAYLSEDSTDSSWQDRFSTVRFVSIDSTAYDGDFGECVLTDAEQIRISLDKEAIRQYVTGEHCPPFMAWYTPTDRERERDLRHLDHLPPTEEGCGTHRVFGRMAVVHNWGTMVDRIRTIVSGWEGNEGRDRFGNAIPAPADDGRNVVIVASLGGGTGTGIFLDVAAAMHFLQREMGGAPWNIMGFFFLPDATCLRRGMKPHQKANVHANSYAALKELDHLLHGNPFEMEYGDGLEVLLDNRSDRLFHQVFLVNRDNPARRQLASFSQLIHLASEWLVLDAMTEVGGHFRRRYADQVANLLDPVPTATQEERVAAVVRERRLPLFNSLGFATLDLPVEGLVEAVHCQLALDVQRHLRRSDDRDGEERRFRERFTGVNEGCSSPLTQRLGLTADALTAADGPFPLGAAPVPPSADRVLDANNPGGELEVQARAILAGVTGSEPTPQQQAHQAAADRLLRELFEGDPATGQKARIQEVRNEIIDELGEAWVDDVLRDLQGDVADCMERVGEAIRALRDQMEEERPYWQEERDDATAALVELSGQAPLGDLPIVGRYSRRVHVRREGRREASRYLDAVAQEAGILYDLAAWSAAHDLLEKVREQLDTAITDATDLEAYWGEVESCLRARRRRAVPVSEGIERRVEGLLDTLYRRFVHDLPGEWRPEAVARRLGEEGLQIGGQTVERAGWADKGGEAIAEALLEVTREAVAPPDEPLYLRREGVAPTGLDAARARLWAVDLRLGGETFQEHREVLKERGSELYDWSGPRVRLNLAGAEALALDYMVSGVGSGGGDRGNPENWDQFFNRQVALQRGSHRTRLTSLRFLVGFPACSLERAEYWRRHYLHRLYLGKSLHVLPGGRDLPEVVLPEYGDLQAELLFELAQQYHAVTTLGRGFYLDSPHPQVRMEFHPSQEAPVPLTQEALNKAAKDHPELVEELRQDLLERSDYLLPEVRKELLASEPPSSERIVGLAINHNVVTTVEGGYIFDNERPAVHRLFHPPAEQAQGLPREAFIRRMERNLLLYQEVLEETAERIVEQEQELARRLQEGGFGVPALDAELEDYLTRPADEG